MPITFTRCEERDDSVNGMVVELINQNYPDLRDLYLKDPADKYCDADLVRRRIMCLFAWSDGGHAVMLHGYPCAATIKVNTLKDRVQGKGDVTIEIDGESWKDRTEPQQRAVLDHELNHLIVKRKNGEVVLDDQGRPKFDMRLHDLVVGGFAEILKRHGDDALDHAHLVSAHKRIHEVTGKNLTIEFDDNGRLIRQPQLFAH